MFFTTKKDFVAPQIIIPHVDVDDDIIKDYNINKSEEEIVITGDINNVNDEVIIDNEDIVNEENESEDLYDTDSSELMDEENCLFIISIDNIPSYYTENLVDAKTKIDKVTKLYSLNDYGNHETHIKYVSETEINIIRTYDFLLLSLNYIIHTLKIYKIRKLEN